MKTLLYLALLSALLLGPLFARGDDKAPAPAPAEAKPATVVKKVDVEEFDKLRADPKNKILDVRTAEEFKDGHIPGAINLDIMAADFDTKAAALDKTKPYLVHCAAGGRSARACKKLEKAGFTILFDLPPGFSGWKEAGKPVEK